MKESPQEFERKVNQAERSHISARHKTMRKEGYKSEKDYFTHTDPFRNKESRHSRTRSISKALANHK
jgi:hypothetical protein